MSRKLAWPAFLLAWIIAAGPAVADPQSVLLEPSHARVSFRAWAFGVIPLVGDFLRFHGALSYDPASPGHCTVEITIDAGSLDMMDVRTREFVLSPDFLDAASWPDIAFRGACDGHGIAGALSLHGVERPLSVAIARTQDTFVARATLRRADWGMTARPLLAGPDIGIEVAVRLPAMP